MKSRSFGLLIMAVIGGTCLPIAIGALLEPRAAERPVAPSRWTAKEGLRVELPDNDVNGQPLKLVRERLIVFLSCASCSLNQYHPSTLVGPKFFDPTIVVFDSTKEDVPKSFLQTEGLQVICYPESQRFPHEFTLAPPQVAVVSAEGIVTVVPSGLQSLISFMESVRGTHAKH